MTEVQIVELIKEKQGYYNPKDQLQQQKIIRLARVTEEYENTWDKAHYLSKMLRELGSVVDGFHVPSSGNRGLYGEWKRSLRKLEKLDAESSKIRKFLGIHAKPIDLPKKKRKKGVKRAKRSKYHG